MMLLYRSSYLLSPLNAPARLTHRRTLFLAVSCPREPLRAVACFGARILEQWDFGMLVHTFTDYICA